MAMGVPPITIVLDARTDEEIATAFKIVKEFIEKIEYV